MSEIAIASVAKQKWNTTYDCKEGFQKGTIFPELYRPFFVEEQEKCCEAQPHSETEIALLSLQECTFSLIDVQLYLDTHPEDADALHMKQQLQKQRKAAMEEFSKEYYPLTMDCCSEQCCDVAPWD